MDRDLGSTRTSLKIFSTDFDFLGDIEDFNSFYFVRSFFHAKEFQLVAPLKYVDILKNDYYIYLSPSKAMIIEDIEVDEDNNRITVKGRDIKSILERRVILPPSNAVNDESSGYAEAVIKHYVNVCCVNPIDAKRKIPNLSIAINKNRGLLVKWQSRFKNLSSEVESISQLGGIGWFITMDPKNKTLIFDVALGVDRTAGQSINSRVIFANDYSNITNTKYTNSSTNYKNVAYVGGQGEGTDRAVEEIKKKDAFGVDRREVFIDARDISDVDNLEDRALSKLSAFDYVINTDSTIINKNQIYEQDWNLGDLVTVKNIIDTQDLQINEVREIYEGVRTIEITVGTIEKNVIEQINGTLSSNPNEAGSTTRVWYPTIDGNGNISWELNSTLEVPIAKNLRGPQGIQGPVGPQGQQGPQGMQGIKGDTGAQGVAGKNLEFTWNGTQLGVRQQGQTNYIYVDLKGAKGDQGIQGVQGPKGDTGLQGAKGSDGVTPTIGANGNWFIGSKDTGKPSRGVQGTGGGVQGGTQIIVQTTQPTTQTVGGVWIETL